MIKRIEWKKDYILSGGKVGNGIYLPSNMFSFIVFLLWKRNCSNSNK